MHVVKGGGDFYELCHSELPDTMERSAGIASSVPPRPHPTTVILTAYLWLCSDKLFPVFTILLQNLASVLTAAHCVWRFPCDLFIDTTGFAFTLPVARVLCGAKAAAYVHYPTMSRDMLQRVWDRKAMYNNSSWLAG